MLTLGVLMLVMIDLVILVIYTLVEGVRGNLSAVMAESMENPQDITGVKSITTCLCARSNTIILVLPLVSQILPREYQYVCCMCIILPLLIRSFKGS